MASTATHVALSCSVSVAPMRHQKVPFVPSGSPSKFVLLIVTITGECLVCLPVKVTPISGAKYFTQAVSSAAEMHRLTQMMVFANLL
jgi:hypothetical protein